MHRDRACRLSHQTQTLGTPNDVSGLNTVLGTPTGGTIASNIADVQTTVDAISTAVETEGVATEGDSCIFNSI